MTKKRITKKRKIVILRLLKTIILSERFDGLCYTSLILRYRGVINDYEYYWLSTLIDNNKPRKLYRNIFYWKPFVKKPRIKWINGCVYET